MAETVKTLAMAHADVMAVRRGAQMVRARFSYWAHADAIVRFFVGLFLYTGLCVAFLAAGTETRTFSVAYRGTFFGLCVISLAAAALRHGRFCHDRVTIALLIFWLLYAVRVVHDCIIDPVPLYIEHSRFLLYAGAGCLVPMLAFLQPMTPRTARVAFWGVLIALAFSSLASLLEYGYLLGTNFGRLGNREGEEMNPLSVAYLGSALAGLAVYGLFGGRALGRKLRLTGIALAGLGILDLILGASRGPILALALSALVLVWAKVSRTKFLQFLVLLIVIGVFGYATFHLAEISGSGLLARIQYTMDEWRGAEAPELRLALLRATWSEFLTAPVFGSGIAVQSELAYPHNTVLESFMATGIFGGACFTFVVVVALLRAIRLVERSNEYGWIGLLFVQFFISGMLSGSLVVSMETWYVLAAVLAAHQALKDAPKSLSPAAVGSRGL